MFYFLSYNTLILLSIFLYNLSDISIAQRPNGVLLQSQMARNSNVGSPVICNEDSLLIYHDCRLCVCMRPNRMAKCFKKPCDLRTKDTGQCPPASLRMDDGKNCQVVRPAGCNIDADCPGNQLCCFDFCGSPKCSTPIPLDVTTGLQVHGGRGYK